jgi:ppGpp synthetase/RelA/SpoT-type nucleotidyltranferase
LPPEFSKSQIDRLGDRLRADQHLDSDLELLDAFRSSFGEAQKAVVERLRGLGLNPAGRIAKTTPSIVAKLKRSDIRLARIQDIAGCRIVVDNIAEQDRVVGLVTSAFPKNRAVDRREKPSYGYRAVHVIVEVDGRQVEVQIRTQLQQLWARLSEGWASLFDQAIKYGGGLPGIQEVLQDMSDMVARVEGNEQKLSAAEAVISQFAGLLKLPQVEGSTLSKGVSQYLIASRDLARFKQDLEGWFRNEILELEGKKDSP